MLENMLIKVTIEVLRECTHKIAGILFSCLIGQWGWSVWSTYSSLTTSLCQIVLCQSWKALQHGSADCSPVSNPACLWPTHLVWSPLNAPAFCPRLWNNATEWLFQSASLWLLVAQRFSLCCHIHYCVCAEWISTCWLPDPFLHNHVASQYV